MQHIEQLLKKKDFSFTVQLFKAFPKAEVFLVGGIIRDLILKRESKDYDFVVRNIPITKLQTFLKKLGWVDLVGKTFGVLKFLPKESKITEPTCDEPVEPIDIALPRTEHAFMTGGYRDVDVQSNPKLPIEDDLGRRDFTINALAYDIKSKKLIDLYKGLDDIRKKRIKAIGNPAKRFKEDYSRILRGLRFACQLDFSIEPETWSAVKKQIPHLNKKVNDNYIVPRETIAKELVKTFVADPVKAFELYDKSGAMTNLMPELLKMKKCPQPKNFHSEGDVWKHTLLCLQNLASRKFINKFGKEKPSAELIIALLLHDIGKPYTLQRADRLRFNNHDAKGAELASEIMSRLRFSNGGINPDKTNWLIRKHMIATHTKKSPMKNTTIEKYFFNDQKPGQDLLKLIFADVQATIPQNGRPNFTEYNKIEKQISRLKKTGRAKKLPDAILNGTEIMKICNVSAGPYVGQLKKMLREHQLKGTITTKQQARALLLRKK